MLFCFAFSHRRPITTDLKRNCRRVYLLRCSRHSALLISYFIAPWTTTSVVASLFVAIVGSRPLHYFRKILVFPSPVSAGCVNDCEFTSWTRDVYSSAAVYFSGMQYGIGYNIVTSWIIDVFVTQALKGPSGHQWHSDVQGKLRCCCMRYAFFMHLWLGSSEKEGNPLRGASKQKKSTLLKLCAHLQKQE